MLDDDAQYGLVMPFVVTESEGGPYDARAFVAGYEASCIDDTLRTLTTLQPYGLTEVTVKRYVHPPLIPQLDLIAMKHGFTLTHEPWEEHPDEWTLAVFRLVQPGADSDEAG